MTDAQCVIAEIIRDVHARFGLEATIEIRAKLRRASKLIGEREHRVRSMRRFIKGITTPTIPISADQKDSPQ